MVRVTKIMTEKWRGQTATDIFFKREREREQERDRERRRERIVSSVHTQRGGLDLMILRS